MKRVLMGLMLLSSLFLSNVSYAGYAEGTPFSSGNTNTTPAPDAYGQIVRIVGGSTCKATAAPPSYSEGDEVPLSCELDGDLRTNSTGGGAGDASLAEQQTQTGILTTIDADTGTIAGAVKAEDAAHASGDTGVMSLCVRTDTAAARATTDGDYIPCTTDADGRIHTTNPAIDGTKIRSMLVDGSGNEIVVPTAGLTSYTAAGASTNATNVKGSAGTVYGYSLTNTTTTIYYLRMYNLSSAPTCSSATGYVSTIPIPPAAASGGAGGREINKNIGQAFTTGIGFCVTGGASSTDNTSAATGVFVEILYK